MSLFEHSEVNVSYCFPHYGQKSDQILVDIIETTQISLDIAIFNFLDKKILEAILFSKTKGTAVRIITDKYMSINPLQHHLLKKLKNKGVLIKKNSHKGFMHLKMTISDKKIVTVGSPNFTKSSQGKNDEVFIVLRDKCVASDFSRQFELMWNNAKDFTDF